MKPAGPKGKILVIRGGAIGDFILTLPAIAALRKQFPETHLEVLGYPHIVKLALAGGLVDRVQPIEARALASFFARNGELEEDLQDYFSEFNIVVSYLYDPDDIFKTNLARCLHGQFLAGPHRPDENERVHATQVFLKPLERLAIFDADAVPRLALSSHTQPGRADLAIGRPAPKGTTTIALHPASGSERKNWPEAKWVELLKALVKTTQHHLLLVGGEAEGTRLELLVKAIPKDRFALAKNLPLTELAILLCSCVAFVGHDSGITHLAAALGLPTLTLWADTIEEIWRPQGQGVVIVKEPHGLPYLGVQRVLDELKQLLAQRVVIA